MEMCPECGSKVSLTGAVGCLCDKDFCGGQRCGANKLHHRFKCQNEKCGLEGTPRDTKIYYNVYGDK